MRILKAVLLLVLFVSPAMGFETAPRKLAPARTPGQRPVGAQPDGELCGNGNTFCSAGEVCTSHFDCVTVCGTLYCWYQLESAWQNCPAGECLCQ